ncbi:MAG: hypothetical protein MI757_15720 [Pirellulales bacterium]|nr:hypothetical protein [Pirellulales bacterium]
MTTTRTPLTTLCLVCSLMVFGMGQTATAATVMQYDVNDTATNITQSGWLATDKNNLLNQVTFTPVGAGISIDDRDRGTANGGGAEAAMWRDFIFAVDSNLGSEGLDITITGLPANETIGVRLWAFDESSDGGRNELWNGNPLSFPSSPDPTSLNDYVVSFDAVTDNAGVLTLQGRSNGTQTQPHNVFVNGFELTVPVPVPEPTTAGLAAFAVVGLVGGTRRRRRR